MADYILVYDGENLEKFQAEVMPALESWQVESHPFSEFMENHLNQIDLPDNDEFEENPGNMRILTWLGDAQLSQMLLLASQQHWQVGILPHPEMLRFYRSFPLNTKMTEALADIKATESAALVDLMTCNQQLVLGAVLLGNPQTMKPASEADLGFLSKLKSLFLLTFHLSQTLLKPYCFTTAKQSVLNTAALGVALVYRPSDSEFSKSVVGEALEDEPMLYSIILAPRSISEVMRFLIGRIFPKKYKGGALASYLGMIKTEKLTLTSPKPIDYYLNGETLSAEVLEVEVQADALLLLSQCLPKKSSQKEIKESMRVVGLPVGQAMEELVSTPLPWIHHTDPEEVKDTFVMLKENAQLSESYLVLTILSSLLATIGLFANSASVIIGAMILAPLMSPIISLSMGALRQNSDLMLAASKTLVIGILLALGFGTLLTLLTPLHVMNHEISTRLSPTILDLGVAIISGIAGAYAHARSEVAKSLAGVAIAVALVPPLAVSGIGIGWQEWAVFYGAFLLFITNLIGIVLAAALTFLLMGFSPFHLAKKGMLLTLLSVIFISIPLGVAFHKMVIEERMVYALEGWKVDDIGVRDVKVRTGNPDYVSVTLVSNKSLGSQDIDRMKQQIEQKLGQPIRLEARLAVVR